MQKLSRKSFVPFVQERRELRDEVHLESARCLDDLCVVHVLQLIVAEAREGVGREGNRVELHKLGTEEFVEMLAFGWE